MQAKNLVGVGKRCLQSKKHRVVADSISNCYHFSQECNGFCSILAPFLRNDREIVEKELERVRARW